MARRKRRRNPSDAQRVQLVEAADAWDRSSRGITGPSSWEKAAEKRRAKRAARRRRMSIARHGGFISDTNIHEAVKRLKKQKSKTKSQIARALRAERKANNIKSNPMARRRKNRSKSLKALLARLRKNPGGKRRSKRRKNPIALAKKAVGSIKSVFSVRALKIGASAGVGMVVARSASAVVSRIPVVGGLVNMLGRFRDPVVGAVAVVLAAQLARKVKKVPLDSVALAAGGLGVAIIDAARALGLRAPGSGMGDYLTLSGPVPEQLFAGGLNDYIDFTSPAAGAAAQAASFAQTSWTPGAEGFSAGGE